MNAVENICPVCQESNDIEAVVCGRCGAALEDPFLDPGAKTKTASMPAVTAEQIRDWSINKSIVPENGIAVYIEDEFHPTHIDSRGEFVIGRRAGTTASVPVGMLDLSASGGYARGISRRHAVIRRTDHGYEILDLGSINGTWLNGERLAPHKYYPLASGSHLRLGNMRLVVLYRPPVDAQQNL